MAEALARIEAAGLPAPSVVVNSGHGVHVYWLLYEPLTDLEDWGNVQRHLVSLLDGDPHCVDSPRVMRLPGFMNPKPPAAPCVLIYAKPSRRFTLEDLLGVQQREPRGERGLSETREPRETREVRKIEEVEEVGEVQEPEAIIESPFSNSLLKQVSSEIEDAIQKTLPTKVGQRHRQVFKLARALKAIPALADQRASILKPVVREWHRRAKEIITTKAFDETWADFVAGWPRVKYALGKSPLDQTIERVKAMPFPVEAEGYDTEAMKLLVAILAELQRIEGDGPIFLSGKQAATAMGVNSSTVSRYMKTLEEDDLLDEVEKFRPMRSTRWRWRGSV